MATEAKQEVCWRCRGDKYFFRVPTGFNPFCAGAMMAAQVSRKVPCYTCRETGFLAARKVLADSEKVK